MQSQFANAAVKTFFVLSSATLLASCASTQRAEEFAVNPVVAPKATVETLQKIDTSTESAGISEEQNLSSPDIRFSSNPTLSQVLKRAYDNHPDIRAAGFEHKARQAEVRQASRRPNPEITTELENFAGNGGFSGFEGSEATVAVSQRLELGGKRKKRTAEAVQNTRVAAFQFEAKRLEVFQNTSRRFYEALAAQEELKVTTDLLQTAKRLERSVDASVRAGKVNILEQQRVNLITRRANIAHNLAKTRRLNSLRLLASVLDLPSHKVTSVSGNLLSVSLPLHENVLKKDLKANPLAEQAAAEVARRQATLAIARADRIPDVTLTGGTRFDQESNDRAFVLEIGLPIPVFNQNKGTVAAAQARVNQGVFEQRAQVINLEALFSERYGALVSQAQQILTFQKTLLPAARQNFQTTRRAFDQGSVDIATLIASQQTLTELQLELVRASAQYHQTRIELEALLGRSVTSSRKIR